MAWIVSASLARSTGNGEAPDHARPEQVTQVAGLTAALRRHGDERVEG